MSVQLDFQIYGLQKSSPWVNGIKRHSICIQKQTRKTRTRNEHSFSRDPRGLDAVSDPSIVLFSVFLEQAGGLGIRWGVGIRVMEQGLHRCEDRGHVIRRGPESFPVSFFEWRGKGILERGNSKQRGITIGSAGCPDTGRLFIHRDLH